MFWIPTSGISPLDMWLPASPGRSNVQLTRSNRDFIVPTRVRLRDRCDDQPNEDTCTIPVPMTKLNIRLFMAFVVAGLCACGSRQPLQVTTIQLGRTVNSDHTVGGFTTTFAPDDTIYLAVLTGGAGSATIRVRWTYGGHVIDEPKKQVSYNQAAATDFRLQSPGGFPRGEYTAEVFVNDQSAGTRTFHVEVPR